MSSEIENETSEKSKKAKEPEIAKNSKLMTEEEKRERIKYLWFRVKVIASADLFIHMMKKSNHRS